MKSATLEVPPWHGLTVRLRLAKFLGGIIADFAKRFESYLTKIRRHANKIEVLAQRGYTTTLLDSKETLDKTAQSQLTTLY